MNDGPQTNHLNHVAKLPEGVSLAQWALEKVRWQNPRIRCLLGSIRMLDDVLESNFAILHCSPRRLEEIWTNLRGAAETIRLELVPLLADGSVVPALDEAVRETAARVAMLQATVLGELAEIPAQPEPSSLDELRATICVAMGKVQSFLLDSLGVILTADPRSQDNSDYFLSRRFARDVDDAEWLHTSVWRLEQHLVRLNRYRVSSLTAVADHVENRNTVPKTEVWETTRLFIDDLVHNLTPKLKRIVGLRGIRIDELDIVESSVVEIPRHCALVAEVYSLSAAAVHELEASGSAEATTAAVQRVLSDRLVYVLRQLDNLLRDLLAFVPLWRANLAQRRALAFRTED